MPLLLKFRYNTPRKFYKQHLQDLKYKTYTTEDVALLNHFGLVEFEEPTIHQQLPYIGQLEEEVEKTTQGPSNTQDGFKRVNLSSNGLLMNTRGTNLGLC